MKQPHPIPTASTACLHVAAMVFALGCGPAAKPVSPAVPSAPVATAKLVERDAPFVVDWQPQQMAGLEAALRSPSIGAPVVAYQGNAIRLLPGCWLSGAYARQMVKTFAGKLQVRSHESAGMTAGVQVSALQQISTSTGIPRGALVDYRFIIAGRYDTSANRPTAGVLELQERAPDACRGATHFVRAASVGAFERMLDAEETAGAPANGPGAGAPASGQSQPAIPARGGDIERCVISGDPAAAACSAILMIELSAIQPARVNLSLVSFAVGGQPASNLRFRFRVGSTLVMESTSFASSSGVVNLLLPTAEITEDAPLVIDAVQQTSTGAAAVVATGQVTMADLRRKRFQVDLHNPVGQATIGAAEMMVTGELR